MSRYVKVEGERGLYQDPNSGIYYVRVQYGGRDTYKSLETNLKRKALEGLDARRQVKVAAKFGLAFEPDETARTATVAEIRLAEPIEVSLSSFRPSPQWGWLILKRTGTVLRVFRPGTDDACCQALR